LTIRTFGRPVEALPKPSSAKIIFLQVLAFACIPINLFALQVALPLLDSDFRANNSVFEFDNILLPFLGSVSDIELYGICIAGFILIVIGSLLNVGRNRKRFMENAKEGMKIIEDWNIRYHPLKDYKKIVSIHESSKNKLHNAGYMDDLDDLFNRQQSAHKLDLNYDHQQIQRLS
jgi:hypothetical protein